jgi:ABC-2 type transport system permease protein
MTIPTTTTSGPTPRQERAARRRPGPTRRLVASELRLLGRDPLTLTFVVVFPVLTMLIIGGSFGTDADDAFPVNPSHWYVASYLSVVIGATGLIMLPVHIASYRERGVLRRFTASGFPRWSFAVSELVVGLTAIAIGSALLLAVAAPVYGVPAVEDPLRTAVAVLVGAVAFVSVGVLLGTLLPSARAAQAIGLVLFFPSFLLGVGGPPPGAMSPSLRSISEWLPLAMANDAVRSPWLGLDSGWTSETTVHLALVTLLAVVAGALAARRTSL